MWILMSCSAWQVFCILLEVEIARRTMTDLTLSQFESLSKQELDQLLQLEEFKMNGVRIEPLAGLPNYSFSVRLLRLICSILRIPFSLH